MKLNDAWRWMLLAVVSGVLVSCAAQGPGGEVAGKDAMGARQGVVSHVVVCYLKHHGDSAERQKLIEATRALGAIPGIEEIKVGYALPSTRPAVVSDFDVALVMTFKDAAAMAAYVKDPRHQKAVKEVLEPLTSKIVVYDFVNQE